MTLPEDKSEEKLDDGSMPLTAHLEELRSRIIKSLLAIVFGSCVSYFFLDEITNFLTAPVGKLYRGIFNCPADNFFSHMEIFFARVDVGRTRNFRRAGSRVSHFIFRGTGIFIFSDNADGAEIFYGIQLRKSSDNVFVSKLLRLRDNVFVAFRICL